MRISTIFSDATSSSSVTVTTVLAALSILSVSNGSVARSGSPQFAGRYFDINDDVTVNVNAENTRPIVGILTQEVSNFVRRHYPDKDYNSYIAASYVKFIEGAGGRVVPIWIDRERKYYEDIMSKINGVLMPGGATYFNQSHGYADAGHHLYDIAIKMNERGIYMPIWGTCLGYELLVYLSANATDLRTDCSSSAQALPLEFEKGYKESRLFAPASDEVVQIFSTYNVTANFHIFCFTKETFADHGLNNSWNVLSVNHDWNGAEFISTVEHVKYPFYGVQFHPEKVLYEFIPNRNITHTSQAVIGSQYFADFFVNEARKNRNNFANRTEEINELIYNYQPEYTGALGSAFVQQYLFEAHISTSTRTTGTASTAGAILTHCLLALITLFILDAWRRV
ncbi:PREDICTED: gamma-glutamyl hydrolase A [Bactrocera latifrons]|uniref:folate gamma-glutamyl hydrolase n=2 Tax=Bactrocera latifrons TaxID=174628 RepID=A0A0K8VJE0_BACLA|nr:PREDICTED: gamma-glutamyl hydrolase A [Bactrocera latifrons]XP_018785745.1 PREDICTED: gamma-glutamyl hydrolase A [Bactrocera latifrons]